MALSDWLNFALLRPTLATLRRPGVTKQPPTVPLHTCAPWEERYEPHMRKIIRYAGIRGDHSEREVLIACRGSAPYGYEYLGVYEGKRFKILRASRVLAMRDAGQAAELPRTLPS